MKPNNDGKLADNKIGGGSSNIGAGSGGIIDPTDV